MTGLVIREAVPEDLPALVALLAEDATPVDRELVADPPDPRYRAAFDAIAADSNQLLAAAGLDGEVVGTLQLNYLPGLSFRGAWRGQIESVRVASHLRGRGIGAELIGRAVAQCRARGCILVQLASAATRTDAHRFYERLGWKRSHAGFKLQLREID